ncbi:hypothetical protein GCM10010124_02000 [Pilimelia terevasa]|uniref:Uncharacterized protein n=1 Tax=Pilimelia terevasa TaxID=53372 RepID=A0A8J3BIP1_9ACTN|nr:hypothetical protein [Pilimelia terevasa]GGK13059.1 hypothetical protein GCM10010124_02000 [Pilimelia terevasa]
MAGDDGKVVRYEHSEGGIVYVRAVLAIHAIVQHRYQQREGHDPRVPALRVSTYLDGQPGCEQSLVRMGSHRYSIDQVWAWPEASDGTRWWDPDHTQYRARGLRTEHGIQLKRSTETGKMLAHLARDLRDRFTVDRPGWAAESQRLRLANDIAVNETEARQHRESAERRDADAARLRVLLEALR